MPSAGSLYLIKSKVCHEILKHFMLLSADKLYRDAVFFFQQNLASVNDTKTTSNWFTNHDLSVLDYPTSSLELHPIDPV